MTNILIVDDSATMRKLIRRALRQAGVDVANVEEASDGAEGFAAFQKGQFDVVLSDINMPNMNGLEMVSKIREAGESPPIIMITTEGSDSFVQDAMKRGANGYLKKPFTSDDVNDVFARVVG